MSMWYRFHLDDTIKATATPDGRRFFVHVREPAESGRKPLDCYRIKLTDAQDAADRIVQAYYPHDCDGDACDIWRKLETDGS